MKKTKNHGQLVVISGPSGSGKDTVVKEVLKTNKNAWLSVSCTSRKPRPGEVYGKDYYFLTNEEFEEKIKQYTFAAPFTKESLLYRELFEQYYPGQARMVSDFWMPNKNWEGCNVNDPSARVLSNYGDSGK